jgi:hypothetical protein
VSVFVIIEASLGHWELSKPAIVIATRSKKRPYRVIARPRACPVQDCTAIMSYVLARGVPLRYESALLFLTVSGETQEARAPIALGALQGAGLSAGAAKHGASAARAMPAYIQRR